MGDELDELASEIEKVLDTLDSLEIENRHDKRQAHNLVEALEEGLHRFEERELGEFSFVKHQG